MDKTANHADGYKVNHAADEDNSKLTDIIFRKRIGRPPITTDKVVAKWRLRRMAEIRKIASDIRRIERVQKFRPLNTFEILRLEAYYVAHWLLLAGMETPPTPRRLWSDEDDCELIRLKNEKNTNSEIAKQLNRTTGSVIQRVRMLRKKGALD